MNGILADEMGLGKTIQSIAILALVESLRGSKEPRTSHHIVIVPKIVLGKWVKEMQQWVPSLRVFCFYGPNDQREQLKGRLRSHDYDVMVTTFETVMMEKTELAKYQFEYLILDEA